MLPAGRRALRFYGILWPRPSTPDPGAIQRPCVFRSRDTACLSFVELCASLILFAGMYTLVDQLLHAQTPARPAASPPATAPTGLPGIDALAALKYRSIGPSAGGRVSRVAACRGRSAQRSTPRRPPAACGSPSTAASPGSRSSTTSRSRRSARIAVAPSDPNVVYVGSGEANIRGNVAAGQRHLQVDSTAARPGSTSGSRRGRSARWSSIPTNPDVAFAAVLGHAFGPNPERGVYRTTRRRQDLEAGAQEERRHRRLRRRARSLEPERPLRRPLAGAAPPVGPDERRPGQRPYVSRDGGDTWKRAHAGNGLPEGIWGKVGVAVAPSDGRRVYALIEAEKGGLFRSDDGGETLDARLDGPRRCGSAPGTTPPSPSTRRIRTRSGVPQVPLLKSIDGGKTLQARQAASTTATTTTSGSTPEPAADDRRQRRRRRHLRPTAARPGSRRRCRSASSTTSPATTGAVPRRRRPCRTSAPRQGPSNSLTRARHPQRATGTASAAARPAAWSPTRPIPNIVYAGEYLRLHLALRPPHRRRRATSASSRTTPPGHGAEDMQLPLPVDGARSPSRRTIRRSSITAATCSSAPRTAARPGRRSAPT